MKIEFKINNNQVLKKVKVIKPSKYIDHRGFIYTNFNNKLEKKNLTKKLSF